MIVADMFDTAASLSSCSSAFSPKRLFEVGPGGARPMARIPGLSRLRAALPFYGNHDSHVRASRQGWIDGYPDAAGGRPRKGGRVDFGGWLPTG